MRVVLWLVQVVLALVFLAHGIFFVAPPPEVAAMISELVPPWFRVFIGVAEVLAAVGLILPAATRILPWLTPLAGAGLMVVMAGAAVLHMYRGETSSAVTTAVLFVLATFVAYMRWRIVPIAPRSTPRTA